MTFYQQGQFELPKSPKKKNENPERDALVARLVSHTNKTDFGKAAREITDEFVNEFKAILLLQKKVLSLPKGVAHPYDGQEFRIKFFEAPSAGDQPVLRGVFRMHEKYLVQLAAEYVARLKYLKPLFVASRKRGRNPYHPSSFKSGYAIQAGDADVVAFVRAVAPYVAEATGKTNDAAFLFHAKNGILSSNAFQDLFLMARARNAPNAGANTPLGSGTVDNVPVNMAEFYNSFNGTNGTSLFQYFWNNSSTGYRERAYNAKTPEGKKGWRYRSIPKEARVRTPNVWNQSALDNLKRAEPGRLILPYDAEVQYVQFGLNAQANLSGNDPRFPVDYPAVGAFPQFMFRMFSALVLAPGPESLDKVLNAARRSAAANDPNYPTAEARVRNVVADKIGGYTNSAGALQPAKYTREMLVQRDQNGIELDKNYDLEGRGFEPTQVGQQLVDEYKLISRAKKAYHDSERNKDFRKAKQDKREAGRKRDNEIKKELKRQARMQGVTNYAAGFGF